jgi:predicted lipoprotein with Yx(FWY)xxD motif
MEFHPMKFKKSFLLAAAPAATAVVVAGCGGGGGGAYGAAAPAKASAPAKSASTSIAIRRSAIGPLLVDGSGRTLYLFEADKSAMSTCYSACASIWPPVTTSGTVRAGSGVLASRLGATKRSDGKTEVTYNGHPLYYYAADTKPGDTAGQGLNQFGAKWYVVGRDGNKIDNDGH